MYLVLAAAAGAAATVRVRGVPYAGVACALSGLVVSVLISLPLNDKGPHLLQVAVLPAAAGAICGALAMRLLLTSLRHGVE